MSFLHILNMKIVLKVNDHSNAHLKIVTDHLQHRI